MFFQKKCLISIPIRTLCGLCVLAKPLGVLSRHPCRTPSPFPQERGYITGATAPRPCRGLRPCDPIFNIYKRFFDSLYPRLHKQPGVVLYPSVFLIPKNNLKKPASILGVLQTTIFIICTSLSAKEHQPYSQRNEQQ